MPFKSAHKKNAQASIIYLTFFLLLSIPIILFGLAQDDFDTRRKAFQDLDLSQENPCLISLPNVNPYTLEIGKTVSIQVDAKLEDEGISRLEIFDPIGNIIYQESFEGSPIEIATSFPFTPQMSGKLSISGILSKTAGGSVECQITSPYGIQGLEIVPNNSAPEFTSKPSESIPSQNIQTGDKYEYVIAATDDDGDRINYTYSFTPRADWLRPTILEDGSSGKLTIKFTGQTDKAASYLANVFIHDGYSTNLRSQSWVINVSPSENDIPIVTITDPSESLRVDKGTAFKTAWDVFDLNQIIRHQLYITNNPANEDVWISIDTDIPYDQTSYNINTQDLDPGTYRIIAQAVDNQEPPGIGKGVSPEIVVSLVTDTQPDDDERDDGVFLNQPQIINMSPLSTEEIKNKRVTVRATIVASKDAEIMENSILFKLDDKDISSEIKFNKISQREYTLIFQPLRDLEAGLHKAEVTFSDTQGLETTKSWNFTIQDDQISTEDAYVIFGYEIAKNIVHIVGIGVITVVLALIIPFIIFSVWKEDKSDLDKRTNTKLPPSIPSDDTKYIQTEDDNSEIREKVQSIDSSEKVDDAWDMYSAPEPVQVEEQKQQEEKPKEVKEEPEIPEPVPIQPQTLQEEPVTEIQEEEVIMEEEKPKEVKEEPETPEPVPIQYQTLQEEPVTEIQEEEIIMEEEKPKEIKEEPEIPEPVPIQQEVPSGIPEPDIPDISDLEKISEQLQQIKQQEQQETQPTENTQ